MLPVVKVLLTQPKLRSYTCRTHSFLFCSTTASLHKKTFEFLIKSINKNKKLLCFVTQKFSNLSFVNQKQLSSIFIHNLNIPLSLALRSFPFIFILWFFRLFLWSQKELMKYSFCFGGERKINTLPRHTFCIFHWLESFPNGHF
jgi:hypothetical protein